MGEPPNQSKLTDFQETDFMVISNKMTYDTPEQTVKSRGPLAESLLRLRKNRIATAGLLIILLFLRIIHGARISMIVGVVAVAISLFFGTIAGAIAGFYRGKTDNIIMRLMDILLAFPPILLAIVIVAFLGPSLRNAMIAIGVVSIPRYARLVRGSVLEEYSKDYVQAARALGAKDARLIFIHILPNCLAPLIVQTTLGFASAILEAAALSFLGLGAQPPTPEWGAMLANGRALILRAWWVVTFPGVMILFAVLGFNLLGDGLRDALDPRLRE